MTRLHEAGQPQKLTRGEQAFLRELERIRWLTNMRQRELAMALARDDVELAIRAARGLLACGLLAGDAARQFGVDLTTGDVA